MKGATPVAEFMGKILIMVFIISIIAILLFTFLPSILGGDVCVDREIDSINNLFNDAVGAEGTTTIKNFDVQACVEYIDFSCQPVVSTDTSTTGSTDKTTPKVEPTTPKECNTYSILFVGKKEPITKQIPGGVQVSRPSHPDIKLEKGTYSVEIGPYSIKFLQ